jgi:DNA-binding winged helix-turn-helix (wHTH) protein/predicted ATPase
MGVTSDRETPPRVIDFPPFRLDLEDERLWRDAVAVRLRPKTFAVLRVLVARPGQLVTKDEIWSAVWPGTTVTDDTLTKSIRELRRALGDSPDSPRFIQTVHARGFRWLGPGHARARPARRPAPVELPVPVVGREVELRALDARLEAALEGRRQVVLVGGEAGIGKTTLVDAFFARIAGDRRLVLARGQSVEGYGAGEAYLPVLEALERLCRSSAADGPTAVLRRHAPMWLWHMPSLVAPTDRPALQRETAGATQHRMVRELARALEVLTADRGLVLCIDDLHWSDVSTLTLLDFLARRRDPARLLLVGVFRPADVGPEHPLAALRRELQLHDLCTELTVSRLDEAAIEEYARRRFGDGVQPVARALAASVHRRTEGNPLFMVHVLNDLVAQGALRAHDGCWELRAPAEPAEPPRGVRQFIEQQLERLSSREREVLEAAAVAGLAFSAAAVAAGLETSVVEVEAHCASLARREQFLLAIGTEEWADGTVASRYRFLHQLHHEVLGARATSARRALLHQRIGTRKEAGYGEDAVDIAPQLARHFEEGRDHPRAVHYLARAAEVATRRRAPREAAAQLGRALELLEALPVSPERDLEELSLRIGFGVPLLATRGYAAPEVELNYGRARSLCRGLGTMRQLFPVLHGLWVFYEVRGDLATARELAGELMALAERDGDRALLLQAHHVVGETEYLRGELASAVAHLERAIALYDAGQHEVLALLYGLDPGVVSCCYAGWAFAAVGLLDRAGERIDQALALTRATALPLGSAVALIGAAGLAQAREETRITQEYAAEAITLSVREGLPLQRARAAILHGWSLTVQGLGAQGIAAMRDGLDASVATGARAGSQYFLALLADGLARTGDAAGGLMVIADALAGAAASGERHYEEELHRLRGELLLLRAGATDQAEAEACFRVALERARERGARMFELRAATSLARLWRGRGESASARELLGSVCEGFTERSATAHLRAARALLHELRA